MVGTVILILSTLIGLVWGGEKSLIKNQKEEGISCLMMPTGLGLIVDAFGTKLDAFIQVFILVKDGKKIDTGVNWSQLFVGIGLLVAGYFFMRYVQQKLYILNLNGYYDRRVENSRNELKLGAFEFKERDVDFIYLFDKGMSPLIAKDISEFLKKKVNSFKEESREFHRGYTGIAPIPFVMLTGTYLARERFDEYFEFDKVETQKYYKLERKGSPSDYPPLLLKTDLNSLKKTDEEVVVSVCTTTDIPSSDLAQFEGKGIVNVKLSVETPGDNTIRFQNQLFEYTNQVKGTLEEVTKRMPHLKKIHLVASTQSCLALEIGKMIDDRRMVQIINYHFRAQSHPKYPWGIILNGERKGEYVEYR